MNTDIRAARAGNKAAIRDLYPGSEVRTRPADIVRYVAEFNERYQNPLGQGDSLPAVLVLDEKGKVQRGEKQRFVDRVMFYCALAASGAWCVRRGDCVFMLPMVQYADAIGDLFGCAVNVRYVAKSVEGMLRRGVIEKAVRRRYVPGGVAVPKVAERCVRGWRDATLYRLAIPRDSQASPAGTSSKSCLTESREAVFWDEAASVLTDCGVLPYLLTGAIELEGGRSASITGCGHPLLLRVANP